MTRARTSTPFEKPTRRLALRGWVVTCPSAGRYRFIGYGTGSGLLNAAFFETHLEARAYRRACLAEMGRSKLAPGVYQIEHATLRLAVDPRRRTD